MGTMFTLSRHGSFAVESPRRDSQCGNIGTDVLTYRVTVRGVEADLNASGWLLDNNDVPRYFQSRWHSVDVFPSCERLARTACLDLADLIRSNGGNAAYIAVSVSGIPGSEITCEWTRERDERGNA